MITSDPLGADGAASAPPSGTAHIGAACKQCFKIDIRIMAPAMKNGMGPEAPSHPIYPISRRS